MSHVLLVPGTWVIVQPKYDLQVWLEGRSPIPFDLEIQVDLKMGKGVQTVVRKLQGKIGQFAKGYFRSLEIMGDDIRAVRLRPFMPKETDPMISLVVPVHAASR